MKRILLSALAIAAFTALAWADPPGQVGRLSYVEGTVSISSAAGQAWEPATLNYPLTTGNQLSTDTGSRAEVQVGSTVLQLGPDSGITFEALDDQGVQVRLDKGLMSVRLHRLGQDQGFQVDLQTASVSLAAPGRYRLNQADSGDVTVVTRDGDAQVTGGQASFHVYSDQAATIPAASPAAYSISAAPPPDEWDAWVARRDRSEETGASSQYVSSEMDGAADLGAYGHWTVVAGYGPLWVPDAVPVGWAPYTFGHWVWIEPWGWTWVDDEPWGFAPFHYGRWVLYTGVWCWVPGPIVSHPVFAPALVRWVGGVPMRDRPPGQTHITWVPLTPRQPFRPLYHASPTYMRAVNGSVVYRPGFTMGVPGPIVRRGPGYVTRGPAYMTRGPERIPRGPYVGPSRPYYVPPQARTWAGRPSFAPRPVPPGPPAYVGSAGPGGRGRPWPPQGQAAQDPWLLKRSDRADRPDR